MNWSDLDGWAGDDHANAFATFYASCRPIVRASTLRAEAAQIIRHAIGSFGLSTQATVANGPIEAKPTPANGPLVLGPRVLRRSPVRYALRLNKFVLGR